MTWPTKEAREAVGRTIGAWSLDDAEDREHQTDTILAALAPHVAALVRAERAAALREAAEEMDNTDDPDAVYVDNGDIDLWLRARADREEAGR